MTTTPPDDGQSGTTADQAGHPMPITRITLTTGQNLFIVKPDLGVFQLELEDMGATHSDVVVLEHKGRATVAEDWYTRRELLPHQLVLSAGELSHTDRAAIPDAVLWAFETPDLTPVLTGVPGDPTTLQRSGR